MPVIGGLGVQIIRAVADEIISDDRIAYHHAISAG